MTKSHVPFLSVDYHLDGPRTAAAVAAGRSHLLGASIAVGSAPPAYIPRDGVGEQLAAFGNRPRNCYDLTLAIAVELRFGLPFARHYDDLRAMLKLLERMPPSVLQSAASLHTPNGLRADVAASSLERAQAIQQLAPPYLQQIEAEGLGNVYGGIELAVAIPTATITMAGVPFNRQKLVDMRNNAMALVARAAQELRQVVGYPLNPNDDDAVSDFLYRQAGLPCPLTTAKGHASVSRAALERLASAHPAVPLLLRYGNGKSLLNSALQVLDNLNSDSRAYADLDPLGARTGRYTCSHPPLQSLDSRIREAVEASPGHVLLEADFSQMEIRLLAQLSQEPALLEAFAHNDDVHRQTAARVFGIAGEAVTAAQREQGKTLNFGMNYGQTAFGLARDLFISIAEAETLLAAHAAAYPVATAWMAAVHEYTQSTCEVRTLFGRRRLLPNVLSTRAADRDQARRQAVNTVIQGLAADLMKLALIRLNYSLPIEVRMLLTIHDSVLLEVPEHLVARVRDIVMAEMQTPPPGFTVPLAVNIGVGHTWAECKS